jgi:DNA-binding CsgD family transcriptional regulator
MTWAEAVALGLEPDPPSAPRHRLTERERQIVVLTERGLTSRQIAAELGIAVGTVRTHMSRALAKLGSASRRSLGG